MSNGGTVEFLHETTDCRLECKGQHVILLSVANPSVHKEVVFRWKDSFAIADYPARGLHAFYSQIYAACRGFSRVRRAPEEEGAGTLTKAALSAHTLHSACDSRTCTPHHDLLSRCHIATTVPVDYLTLVSLLSLESELTRFMTLKSWRQGERQI